MKLETIAIAIRPSTVNGSLDADIRGIAYDSRQVRSGYLFVAMPGERSDGNLFVDDALKRGAAAIVSDKPRPHSGSATFLQVPDSRRAAAEVARVFHGDPASKMQVAGITGTNGKTTTAFMMRDILAAAGRAPGLIGTVEYRIGGRVIPASRTTPEAMDLQAMMDQMTQVGCRSCVMEVSSHALAQSRVWDIDFDVGVFTNLTHDHLDYHIDMERYFEAKKQLFVWMARSRKDPAAVINADDPWGRRLAAIWDLRARLITYGCDPAASVRAAGLEIGPKGSVFTLVSPWGEVRVSLSLLGRFNVSNALAAAAACGSLGVDMRLIADVLSRVNSIPGRLEVIPNRRGFHVFVDYAHTDDAMGNVLRALREITAGRLIIVFGCGGNRDKKKRPKMGAVAAELADYSILTSDNPRKENPSEIIEQVRSGFGDRGCFEVVEDRAEAIRRGIGMAGKGDVLLIAGKGHEPFQEFANTIVPFDDREIARKILGEAGS